MLPPVQLCLCWVASLSGPCWSGAEKAWANVRVREGGQYGTESRKQTSGARIGGGW